ncbi:MAG: ligase-associated DNA damage response endonuclease PdeM [Bacteroidia bacterium]
MKKMLLANMNFSFAKSNFRPLPERGIYWEEEQAILLSDLHLGKVSHFRKNGIGVPLAAADQNLLKIEEILNRYELKELIILGDLFHSDLNEEWNLFIELTQKYQQIQWTLIRGNHDRMPAYLLKEAGIQTFFKQERRGIELIHAPEENTLKPSISGHIHPAVLLQGKGRLRERLPCIYVGEQQILLPAFGSFTGAKTIETKSSDRVFVFAGTKVIEV